ncbi:MAG: ATP-binding protein [Bacteroidales bacterium]|jgi:hypothetical protein|nr:ATP-binding protein [Bacteroidales bacterium]
MKELSQHILDIMHNSLSAKATELKLDITENKQEDSYFIRIADNGKGIPPEMLETVVDPYTTSRKSRKVGMGLPLFRMSAEQTNGYLNIRSKTGEGTVVEALFIHSHIDRPPLGDIAGTLVLLMASFPDNDFIYTHQTDKRTFIFDSREIKKELDGVPLNNASVIHFLKDMINENLKEIDADV